LPGNVGGAFAHPVFSKPYMLAEKLQSMKMRAVKVCEKTGIERKVNHQEPRLCANFEQSCLENENS
jgi:hypothetical protein